MPSSGGLVSIRLSIAFDCAPDAGDAAGWADARLNSALSSGAGAGVEGAAGVSATSAVPPPPPQAASARARLQAAIGRTKRDKLVIRTPGKDSILTPGRPKKQNPPEAGFTRVLAERAGFEPAEGY